ncbi:dipeptidase [Galbibacter sp.]|uniref:dipeptidase n=1 Tax=Galbibacter sp. TaxID=2918471 RepID=UPI002CAED112|nr:dipeptidase [Galbibacter sp.]HLV62424.1 dipeptidase [Galbibacter sp.]
MKITKFVFLLTLMTTVMVYAQSEEKQYSNQELTKLAKEIQDQVITIDTHCDFDLNNFTSQVNYSQNTDSQVNLPKMRKGGLDVAWLIVYTGQEELSAKGFKKAHKNAMDKFNAIHRLCDQYAPEEIELALNSEDVRRIHGQGKLVAMIGIENGYSIGTDINNVKKFYDLGGRYMSLAHQGHSQLSDSNTGESDNIWLHNGLSELGKEVVSEMNKYGMMIDISHPSKEAMRQIIALSKAPIIASHSSARALSNHSRNLDDEQLEWIKENGGVVQAVAFAGYVDVEKNARFQELVNEILYNAAAEEGFKILDYNQYKELPKKQAEEYYKKYQRIQKKIKLQIENLEQTEDPVDVADFVNHIDYMVEKIGIDHVGISSDFDGGGGIYGWKDASETLNVTKELIRRGYSKEEIEKLWGGNLLRVMDSVQAVAKEIQSKSH